MSYRTADGKCHTALASHVVVNTEGWALTAWHVLQVATERADGFEPREAEGAYRGASARSEATALADTLLETI